MSSQMNDKSQQRSISEARLERIMKYGRNSVHRDDQESIKFCKKLKKQTKMELQEKIMEKPTVAV
jgi:hypothetical protein